MPLKIDYTDLCIYILHNNNTYTFRHVRRKKTFDDLEDIKIDDCTYKMHLDYTNWLHGWWPWFRFSFKHPFRSINDILRRKKIGLLIFREPSEELKINNKEKGKPIIVYPRHIKDTMRSIEFTKATPESIKAVTESTHYANAWKSLHFQKIPQRNWLIILIIVIMISIVIMYFTGMLPIGPMGGR